ncbi:MAG: TrkH family potassium uptake protein [Bullifex sp.]
MSLKSLRRKIRKAPPSVLLATGFLSIIITGTVLLMLPVSTESGISLTDALFVSTSAVCVTGLSPVDISLTLTTFGQSVLMTLFQIGGLGYALLLVTVITAANGNLSFRNKSLLRESFGMDNRMKVGKVIKFVLLLTFISEGLGTLLLSIPFVRDEGIKGVFIALFTSVSAFNNAGFDLFGDSLTRYSDKAEVLIPVALLIITGGIGFLVLRELILHEKRRKKLSVHAKIVLLMTALLLFIGMLGFMFFQKMSPLEAFFQSVTTRTAGFTTFDQSTLTPAAFLLTIVLMFIGASPCSTAGGIKTTTLFAAIGASYSLLSGKDFVTFRRSVSHQTVSRALYIIVIASLMIFAGTFILSLTEPDIPLSALFYEVTSALATVGLSQNVTGELSTVSKFIIIVLMYVGRVGILTILSCFKVEEKHVKYIEGKLIVG